MKKGRKAPPVHERLYAQSKKQNDRRERVREHMILNSVAFKCFDYVPNNCIMWHYYIYVCVSVCVCVACVLFQRVI